MVNRNYKKKRMQQSFSQFSGKAWPGIVTLKSEFNKPLLQEDDEMIISKLQKHVSCLDTTSPWVPLLFNLKFSKEITDIVDIETTRA